MKNYRVFLLAAAIFLALSALFYYVQHLKATYPFLFSLILRTHPFQEKPSAVVN